jgi:hypothetical protein
MVFLGSAEGLLSHMRAERYSPSDQFARKDYSTPCTLLRPQLRTPADNNGTFLQVRPTCFEYIDHLYPTTPLTHNIRNFLLARQMKTWTLSG